MTNTTIFTTGILMSLTPTMAIGEAILIILECSAYCWEISFFEFSNYKGVER